MSVISLRLQLTIRISDYFTSTNLVYTMCYFQGFINNIVINILIIFSVIFSMACINFLFQGQGMISFIHLSKNVNAAEIGWYDDVILDACCQNIASSDDEIWQYVVEMSVLLVTSTQKSNPRSIW